VITQHPSHRKATPPRRSGKHAEARPFEPGRAEPPLPITDDLESGVSPPRPGKAHPPDDMDEVKPSLDDERRRHRHHPNDGGTTRFGFDPEAADAAADLAGELGATFLEGATRGEDMSDLAMEADAREESELPFVIGEDEEQEAAPAVPAPRRARRR
jgi:hypothetical protein